MDASGSGAPSSRNAFYGSFYTPYTPTSRTRSRAIAAEPQIVAVDDDEDVESLSAEAVQPKTKVHSFYNDPNADVVLRSLDDTLFRISKSHLVGSSDMVAEALTMPGPDRTAGASDSAPPELELHIPFHDPVIVEYLSATLLPPGYTLNTSFNSFDHASAALSMAEYMQSGQAVASARQTLYSVKGTDAAWKVLALASQRSDDDMARAAMKALGDASWAFPADPKATKGLLDMLAPAYQLELLRCSLASHSVEGKTARGATKGTISAEWMAQSPHLFHAGETLHSAGETSSSSPRKRRDVEPVVSTYSGSGRPSKRSFRPGKAKAL